MSFPELIPPVGLIPSHGSGRAWPGLFKLAHHANDHTLYLELSAFYDNRPHIRIGRLQTNPPAFAIEAFQSGPIIVEQSNDYFAVFRCAAIFNDHVIAILDMILDH